MATFKFGRAIDLHWNGYDIQGPAETVFSIPDQLYEEFDADIAPVEPTLVWVDTNEFQTLTNNVSASTLSASFPIALTTTTSGKTISLSSSTNPNGYLLAADGSGGIIFTPASTSGLTSVVGVSPISTVIAGGTVSVSLNANYQTAGTYVTGVSGTAPITASGTTSITVGIDQTSLSAASALNAEVLRHIVKNTTGTTIPKGSAVYVSGATGDNALISLASASSEVTSSKTLGITAESIANDAFGYVIEAGYLTGIDTSATTAGAAVWLGNTPGSLVFVSPPAEPSNSVYLGVVARVQSNNGSILVKVQNGYELNELHDVFVGGVSTALPLVYSSTSSGWIAQALSSVGIADNAIVAAKIATGSVGSAALADNAVVAAKIAAAAVGTSKISSSTASNGWVLTADGAGAAAFAAIASASVSVSEFTASGTWTKPAGHNAVYVMAVGAGGGGGGSGTSNGGGGGSGGLIISRLFPASILGSTASVTIGAAGIGGSAATSVNTGGAGTAGGATIFGSNNTQIYSYGGTNGAGGSTTLTYRFNTNSYYVARVDTGGSTTAPTVRDIEGRGGVAGDTTTAALKNAMDGVNNCGGGGGGGSTSQSAGGRGGKGFGIVDNITAPAGGTSGVAGTSATNDFTGGGGGGYGTASLNGANGGNGKMGGGGGGAGGGSTTNIGGTGGNGGSGYCLVISW